MFKKCCKLYPLSETCHHISIMKALISLTEQKPDGFTQFILSIGFPGAAAAAKLLQSCPTLCDPRDWQPTRLPRPWDSPGKNTGVGCHFLLQCMKVKSESKVAQSCLTLGNPMD